MPIDEVYLTGQLECFESQKTQLVGQLHQIEGAARLCRAMLGKVQRENDEAEEARNAESNGQTPE